MSNDTVLQNPKTWSGRSSRAAAALFNYGNILAILIPLPLGMLWTGASILVYAMNRYHPVAKVGDYTQRAAYRFYGIAGSFVAIASFFPGHGIKYYLAAWAIAAVLLIPLSILDLVRIYRDDWDEREASDAALE